MSRNARSGSRLDTVLFAVCGAFSLIFAGVLPGHMREAFAAGLRRTVVAPLVSLQRRAELSRSAFLTHDATTAQRDSVALGALSVPALEMENERLRRLLGLGAKLRWGFVAAEAIHSSELRSRTPADEFTLTLTAGSDAGVRPFSPVVAPEGLVGMVQTVDPTMSLAITWANPDFRVSAMTADSGVVGIVQAHLGGGPDRPERYLLELRGVPFRSSVQPGTLVVSSGFGGVYPRGIPVGTVLSELNTAEGWARAYLVRPAVPPPEVSSVMILQPQRVAAGVRNVWSSVAAADSAARRVVVAGDSLARIAAARQAAERRAATDSAGATLDSAARAGAPA
ncbi:MAG: rod shape-determining protein MreC, partial [Gemmatimonadaceae bacterium]